LRWKVDFAELSNYEQAAKLDRGAEEDDDDDSDESEYGFDDGDYGF
jgi:hypothetical protein